VLEDLDDGGCDDFLLVSSAESNPVAIAGHRVEDVDVAGEPVASLPATPMRAVGDRATIGEANRRFGHGHWHPRT